MLTVLCVLRSGGDYGPEDVRKLRDAVARHMSLPHRFACLSDVDVPCERIPLLHNWPGWWSKIELFLQDGPALYFDLDTVIVGNIDRLADLPHDFAMIDLRTADQSGIGQSGVMWMRKPPYVVYERFSKDPEKFMRYHEKAKAGTYVGDQAFINDTLGKGVAKITRDLPDMVRSYKLHCRAGVPHGTSVVCFHGQPRPKHVTAPWVRESWA
jgi:hypothetical protein